ncbi:hypothetical protein Droror1_Dr00012384 [Drosera rotundifolia]
METKLMRTVAVRGMEKKERLAESPLRFPGGFKKIMGSGSLLSISMGRPNIEERRANGLCPIEEIGMDWA